MKTLIWVADRPTTAGNMSFRTWRRPSSLRSSTRSRRYPTFLSRGSCTANCKKPPIRVPQAMPTMAGTPKYGITKARVTPATMEPRLKKLEARAGTKNFPRALRMPMARAAREMSSKKGNMMRVIRVVRASFPATWPKSGAMSRTKNGEAAMPVRVMAPTTRQIHAITLLASLQVRSIPCWVSYWVKTVTKAVLSAPSANKSLSRLGMRKATTKASMA